MLTSLTNGSRPVGVYAQPPPVLAPAQLYAAPAPAPPVARHAAAPLQAGVMLNGSSPLSAAFPAALPAAVLPAAQGYGVPTVPAAASAAAASQAASGGSRLVSDVRESNEIFLVVNPLSGGNKGRVFLEVPQPFQVSLECGQKVSLKVVNLLEGESGRKPGFQALRRAVRSGGIVRMIIGGGDGSVASVVKETERYGINPRTDLYVGILPLGTGNDFSRACGWGGKNPSEDALREADWALVRHMVREWADAQPHLHDIWSVSLSVQDDGEIFDIGKDRMEESLGHKQIKLQMVNYFSVGKASKAGYGFDQNRTTSQTMNKLVYGWQALVTELNVCEAPNMRGTMTAMYSGLDQDSPAIFDVDDMVDAPHLLGNPGILLVSNINSIAGGLADFWSNSGRVGVDEPLDTRLLQRTQDPGDGKLEVMSVRSTSRFVTANTIIGAKRLHQGAPLRLVFGGDEEVVYCQVDGEFYRLLRPRAATVTLQQQIVALHCQAEPDIPDKGLFGC
eukprot:TRINITY_DN18137_c0_g1_i2.p1 TRINITY_DN18137_c0_g1~~TRINITY_DN18137_c0_g1_i2.p1  ORF type:complete len:505 (-),score=96.50 TRINITY_DN18137_c0_g1_i2:68-1582(-)